MATIATENFGVINGYNLVVNEKGNIIPLLDVVLTNGTEHMFIPIHSWYEVDVLQPRIGNVIKLNIGKYNTDVLPHFTNDKAEVIQRPSICPICSSDVKINKDTSNTSYTCSNSDCGYFDVIRLLRYLQYCCLCPDFTYLNVYKLYTSKVLCKLEDVYKLTVNDLVRIGFTKTESNDIINSIKKNREIPIQNLYYALLPESKPAQALRIASLVKNMWHDPIKEVFTTGILPTRLVNNGMVFTLVNMFNKYVIKNRKELLALSDHITVTNSVKTVKPSLANRTFVIGNTVSLKSYYIKTMIKLNGGNVEENFATTMYWFIDFAITEGIEANKNVNNAINFGALPITVDELRILINTPMGNEPSVEELEKTKRNLGIYTVPDITDE